MVPQRQQQANNLITLDLQTNVLFLFNDQGTPIYSFTPYRHRYSLDFTISCLFIQRPLLWKAEYNNDMSCHTNALPFSLTHAIMPCQCRCATFLNILATLTPFVFIYNNTTW